MNKKLLMFFLGGFLFLGAETWAQSFVGVNFSVNAPGYSEPIVNDGFTSKLGGGIGMEFGHRFNDVFGFKTLIQYSEIRRKSDGFQGFYIPSGMSEGIPKFQDIDAAYAELDGDIKDKYFLLPVMLEIGWNFNEKVFNGKREEYLRLYISGGGFVGYLVESRQKLSNLRSNIFSDREGSDIILSEQQMQDQGFKTASSYITDEVDRLTYGVTGYLGFSYHFFYRNEFYIELGTNYGLVNLDEKELNGELFTRSATIQFGYRWQL